MSLEQIEESNSAVHLPHHAEVVAQAFANASSPEPAGESFEVPPKVERYFDVAAQVGGLCFNSNSEISDGECQ